MQTITDAVGCGPIRVNAIEGVIAPGWNTRVPVGAKPKDLTFSVLTDPDAEAWCANDNRRVPVRRRQWFAPHRCRPDIPISDTGFICDHGYTRWLDGQIHAFVRESKADYLRRLREEHYRAHPTIEDEADCRVRKQSRPRKGSVVVLCRGLKLECGAVLTAGTEGKVVTKPDGNDVCEVRFGVLTVLTRRDNLKRPPLPPSCELLARLKGRNEPPEPMRLPVVTFMLPEPANDDEKPEKDGIRWPLQRLLLSKTTGSHEQRITWLRAARAYEDIEAAVNTSPNPFGNLASYGTRKLAGDVQPLQAPEAPEDLNIDVRFNTQPQLAKINKLLGRHHLKVIQWAVVEKLTMGTIGEKLGYAAGRSAERSGVKAAVGALDKLAEILGFEVPQIFSLAA